MGGIDVTLAGVDRFASTTEDAAAALVDLAGLHESAGDLVIDAARVPYRTGALLATVHAVGTADGLTLVAGGPGAPYAPKVHARSPFLSDALAARTDDIAALYFDHADSAVALIQGA